MSRSFYSQISHTKGTRWKEKNTEANPSVGQRLVSVLSPSEKPPEEEIVGENGTTGCLITSHLFLSSFLLTVCHCVYGVVWNVSLDFLASFYHHRIPVRHFCVSLSFLFDQTSVSLPPPHPPLPSAGSISSNEVLFAEVRVWCYRRIGILSVHHRQVLCPVSYKTNSSLSSLPPAAPSLVMGGLEEEKGVDLTWFRGGKKTSLISSRVSGWPIFSLGGGRWKRS